MSSEQAARAFLSKSTRLYEGMVVHALRLEARGDDEKTLRWISLAAKIARAAHPGRLSDERLEAIAVRIGHRLQPSPGSNRHAPERASRETGRRVLHVATTVAMTGGHSRILENWIKADNASIHSLFLIDQGEEIVRPILTKRVEASGGDVTVVPPDATLLERARRLRTAVQDGYDVVILHHHPDDVVPLVAFATEDCPPIGLMNHADHVFWLGVSIADVVIEFREFGAELSRERRAARRSIVFPLPLDIQSSSPTRAEARGRLGIAENERMLLSIGTGSKYVPTERHRFFETLTKVLDRDLQARLYVIGVSKPDANFLKIPENDRIELLGIIGDPADYEAAADVYLEGFPFGSYTALLETAARGVRPVVMHSPTAHNDVAREISLRGLVRPAEDEASYISGLVTLLADADGRRRTAYDVAHRIRSHHAQDASSHYIEEIYAQLISLRHEIASLPDRLPQTCQHDVDLASFQGLQLQNPVADRVLDETLDRLSYGGIWKLFAISYASRDTRPTPRHAKSWISIMKRKVMRRLA